MTMYHFVRARTSQPCVPDHPIGEGMFVLGNSLGFRSGIHLLPLESRNDITYVCDRCKQGFVADGSFVRPETRRERKLRRRRSNLPESASGVQNMDRYIEVTAHQAGHGQVVKS